MEIHSVTNMFLVYFTTLYYSWDKHLVFKYVIIIVSGNIKVQLTL